MILLSGKKIAQKIQDRLREEIARKKIKPTLAVILVGANPISRIYIREKEKAAKKVGIKIKKYFLSASISQQKILSLIQNLNRDPKITGILVQLPLPKDFDPDKILASIESKKDVDGLTKRSEVRPPTVAAIMTLLEEYKIPIKNKKVCLVGYGRLVGKPLAPLLKKAGARLTICTRKTKNLKLKTKKADILISATGVPHLVKKEMVKKGAVVIDAGTSSQSTVDRRPSTVVGDVDFAEVKKIASYITPPKGGVGPLTVAKLLENVVKLTTQIHRLHK